MAGHPTSFRLSEKAVKLLDQLEKETSLKRSAIAEIAIRQYAEKTLRKPKKTG